MRILHVFRSPVGGLFRHVCDLAQAQQALGHRVGLLCDSQTGGAAAEAALTQLAPFCELGIERLAISTLPGWGDVAGTRATIALARRINADVIHGHGAKGGVFARLGARQLQKPGIYSPHGGSLHYDWLKPPGAAFLAAERALHLPGTGLIFVCAYERALYARKIGLGTTPSKVVYNGLRPEEFTTRILAADATDLLYVGEMRRLKGVDVLLHALAQMPPERRLSLSLVGEGRDQQMFQDLAKTLGLTAHCRFLGRKPMAEAKALGRVLVLPSRHESFPYVVLEAIGAQIPVIASRVGGIGEMLPEECLVAPGDAAALRQALEKLAPGALPDLRLAAQLQAKALKSFNVSTMAQAITGFYAEPALTRP